MHFDGSISLLEHLDSITDLGVTFDSKLTFDHHIIEKVNKSYSVLGLTNLNFKYMSPDTFVMLYKTLVRSHLEDQVFEQSTVEFVFLAIAFDTIEVRVRHNKDPP